MKNWKIYLDNTLQKTIELKADFIGVTAGDHELKIEAYNGSTLLDTDTRTISVAGITYEPETEAYLNELNFPNNSSTSIYGVPNSEVWQKVNDYILTLKGIGWSKFHRVFPKIGDSALEQSLDLITGLRGNFFGSWIFNEKGSVANGANTYFDTGVNLSTKNTSSIGYTITPTNVVSAGVNAVPVGAFVSGSSRAELYNRSATGTDVLYMYLGAAIVGDAFTKVPHTTQRNATTTYAYKGGSLIDTKSNSGTIPNLNMFEGASHFETSASRFFTGSIGTTVYHEYLTASETATLHNAITTLETALNRI